MRNIDTLQWMITGRCNYHCNHCYLGEDNRIEPDTDTLLSYIPLMKAAGIQKVVLTGGEPLSRADLGILVKELSENGIDITSVITNGFFLNGKALDLFEENGQKPVFCISYDGDGTTDFVRNHKGAQEMALKAFDLCKSRGFTTTSDMTLYRENTGALRSSVKTLMEHGCSSLKVTPLMLVGNAKKSMSELALTPAEVFEAFCDYIPFYYQDRITMEIYLNAYFYAASYDGIWAIPAEDASMFVENCDKGMCANERMVPFLDCEGKLLPCPGAEAAKELLDEMRDVTEQGITGAMDSPGMKRFYGYTLKQHMEDNPDCDKCGFLHKCMGGCRIIAGIDGNGFSGKDRFFCTYFTGNYKEKIYSAARKGKESI